MAAVLPPLPKFVFTVFEPLSLVAGFVGVVMDPAWFVAGQIVSSPVEKLSDNATLVTLQLGNVYLLLAMCAFGVLYSTTEPKVVHNYITALLLADIGHVYVTYYILGYERFVDVASWNALTWGNIGITLALFLIRTGYLLGLFGPDRQVQKEPAAKKSE